MTQLYLLGSSLPNTKKSPKITYSFQRKGIIAMPKRIYRFALTLLFIGLFWHITAVWWKQTFYPPPLAVFSSFSSLVLTGVLPLHFLVSTRHYLLSLTISFALAVPCGFFLARTPWLDSIVSPLLYILHPLPKIVFLPLIVVGLGLGLLPKILLIFLVTFFQLLISARDAARGIPQEWVLTFRSFHATRWQTYLHLVWPASLPKLLTALRISIGSSIAVLFFAETFASDQGLGYLILTSMEKQEIPAMYAGILGMALLGVSSNTIVDLVERYYCHWD